MLRIAVTHSVHSDVRAYMHAVERAGMVPVSNPASLDGLSGLMLCGGVDMDPAHYFEAPHPATQEPDHKRDHLELRLFRRAFEQDLPVLGICRGLQLINVALGGSLVQHLGDNNPHRRPDAPRDVVHHVDIAENSSLALIYNRRRHGVNSRHHQAVKVVGDGLAVTARSDDGVVEAIERPDRRFCLAVQWHPEDRVDAAEGDTPLFEAFATAVRQSALRGGVGGL
jgi:putative glutamine amidotransferase